jgi:hypothetical protein
MRYTASVLTVLLLASLGGAAQAADDPAHALIEHAIKAHGGQERLEKLKADRVTLKGTMFVNEQKGTFTAETTVNVPSQFRNVTLVVLDTKTIKVVQILNGDKALVTLDGVPKDVVPSALTEMREILHLDRAVRLTPLLSDKAITLAALGDSKVHDKPVAGVKISEKGYADLKMYFDKDSGLLVKTEHDLEESGKKVTQEEYYSDFKDIGGYIRPTKLVAFRGGKKLMEAELVDAKYLDKVDEKIFAKP